IGCRFAGTLVQAPEAPRRTLLQIRQYGVHVDERTAAFSCRRLLPLAMAVALLASYASTAAALPQSVSARVELSTSTVKAGANLHGTLVLENTGVSAVDLTDKCSPKWKLAIENRTHPAVVLFDANCDTRPFLVEPGTTRLPFAVRANYGTCVADEGYKPKPGRPACLANGRLPALPPGKYTVTLHGALPAATPVRVEVSK
ncbi:MAG: hypothetical protein ABW211_05360, partial [Acidimicrobiia bacterium]